MKLFIKITLFPFLLTSVYALGPSENHEFQIDATIPVEGRTRGVIAGDIRNDGTMRIIAGSSDSGYVYVYRYEDGTYIEEWNNRIVPGGQIIPTATGDIDNDGMNEFTVNVWGTGDLYVYKWDGVTYQKIVQQHTGGNYMPAAIFDLNRDGFNELILDAGKIRIYKYQSSDTSLVEVWSTNNGNVNQISVGDVDNDSEQEALCFFPWSTPGKVIIIGYNGIEYNVEETITDFALGLGGGTVADIDDDGKDEIITAQFNVSATDFPIYLIEYDGLNYSVEIIHNATTGMFQIHSGDIDGDGLPEVSVLSNGSGSFLVEYGNEGYIILEVPHGGSSVFGDVAETDNDGCAEIITGEYSAVQVVSDTVCETACYTVRAGFSGNPVSTVGETCPVQFKDASLGRITGWSWDFGDAGTSNQRNPRHTYVCTGPFTVRLTVSGPCGQDMETKVDYITCTCPPPCLRGEVNCDGQITPGDALCAFWRSILGSFQEECECECSEQAAEVNCDGSITPGDALCIFWCSILGDWTEECQCPLAKDVALVQPEYKVKVGSGRGAPGEEVRIPIMVENPQNVDAFSMQLLYPVDLLEFLEVSATTLTDDWTAIDGVSADHSVANIGGFHTMGISSKGPVIIAEAVFIVREDAFGQGDFTIRSLTDDLAGADVETGSFVVKSMPTVYNLTQNYPNPFNPDTKIAFSLVEASKVTLTVYNILGQVVDVLVDYDMQPGHHSVTWNARDLSSGIYFYRIVAGEFIATKRMVLLK